MHARLASLASLAQRVLTAASALLAAAGLTFTLAPSALAAPPATRVAEVADTLHGVVITDPYRWLEDQESPETREWLARQIAYTESFFPRFTAKAAVEARYNELERVDRAKTPYVHGGRYFYGRRLADQELWTTWWREGLNGEERLLIDPHTLSEDLRTSAGLSDISHDGRMVAYSIRQGGQDEEEIHFRSVDTGEDLPDILPVNVYMGVSIALDQRGCYYVALLEDRTCRLRYHRFGTPLASDPMLFGEGYGPEDPVEASLSEDGRWLEIAVCPEGGSNGGLLVGAFLTQRPELCRAVVCWHPLLDMLRYHRTLMGPYWISEYGSADVPEQFPYLYAYSPYHHVRRGVNYPSVLFITGDGDTRVDPMHARKMTALLQAAAGEETPILLQYDLKSGHVGGNPVRKSAADAGVELGFLMWQLGMRYESPVSPYDRP